MKRAIFLDRDGVINQKAPEGHYVTKWEHFEFLAGAGEGIAKLKQHGFTIIVVSNQRCVAKGIISIPELETLHERMRGKLAESGAIIDRIYYCPHETDERCSCRKPEPGMLVRAAKENEVDLRESWMIGDSKADIEAGRAAGCKTAYLSATNAGHYDADLVAPSLLGAAEEIVKMPETY
jgi:D-glycero-D-manno-heptose 1,7-bisphosphate phosphatase